MSHHNRTRSAGDRIRDAVLALVALATLSQVVPVVWAAWDASKPANNSALVSSEIRANWTALQNAIGNPDTTPLDIKQADIAAGSRFEGPALFKPGTASGFDATISGRVTTNTTTVGNVGTGEDDLMTYSLAANALAANGKVVRITAGGRRAANTNTKTLKAYFGATEIFSMGDSSNVATYAWRVTIDVARIGATSQLSFAQYLGSSSGNNAGDESARRATPAETLSGAVTIKFTGTATANDDLQQDFMMVEVVG